MQNDRTRSPFSLYPFAALIAALSCSLVLNAADGFQPIPQSELPDFNAELEQKVTKSGRVHLSGYMATVNVMEFSAESLEGTREIKLKKDLTGFREDFKVRAKWHEGSAPLTVILLGVYGKANGKLGKHWQKLAYRFGSHVMCFDSIFRHDVNKRTLHGIPGNLKAEAKTIAKIVNLALDQREDKEGQPFRSKVTSVRLIGTSYGGTLALHLVQTEEAKSWPVDRCLAISPPPSMRSTAELVEQFRQVDLPKYGGDLMKLLDGYTPKNDMPSEKEEGLVRAGIAYVFNNGLKNVVKESEKRYMEGYRDQLKKEEKRIEEETGHEPKPKMSDFKNWSFDDFVNRMAAPYWKVSADELWSYGDLEPLLDAAPAFAQVVICADDPMAKPEDIQALKARFSEPRLIVLPHGGHMGYCGTKWIKSLIWQTVRP